MYKKVELLFADWVFTKTNRRKEENGDDSRDKQHEYRPFGP